MEETLQIVETVTTVSALSPGEFSLVYNMLSLTIAAMGAATVFFFLSRGSVLPKYRPALIVSGLVTLIACYHYVRIFMSWDAAYASGDMSSFNDAYRYVDWLLTVPLLLVELVAVLALPKSVTRSLFTRLVIAAVLMIGLGYPGEISADAGTRWFWWVLSMIPFLYILFVLWVELSKSLDRQPAAARGLISGARLLILISWAFYPIAYMLFRCSASAKLARPTSACRLVTALLTSWPSAASASTSTSSPAPSRPMRIRRMLRPRTKR